MPTLNLPCNNPKLTSHQQALPGKELLVFSWLLGRLLGSMLHDEELKELHLHDWPLSGRAGGAEIYPGQLGRLLRARRG